MKYLTGFFITFALVFSPLITSAETVIRTGQVVSVSQDQSIENDFYVAANTVTMSGVVDGDMYALGAAVTVNGNIAEDLTVFSGSVQVHATVTDDVRVFGGEVLIADSVGGDVFVIGGSLKILSSAHIKGDVYFFGGEVDIAGTVLGSVVGNAGKARVDAVVGKDIDMKTTSGLTLGDKARVAGDVTHSGAISIVRAPNAVVTGSINEKTEKVVEQSQIKNIIIQFLVALFSALVAYLLFRPQITSLIKSSDHHTVLAFAIGFAGLFLSPIVAVVLFYTVLGSVFGIGILLFWLLIIITSLVIMHIVAGAILSHLFIKKAAVELPWVLAGTVLVQVVIHIPFVGAIAVTSLFIFTVGVSLLSLGKTFDRS